MPFVYRYIDKADGVVKYVGIVCRNCDNALHKRIKEHFNSDDWAKLFNWRVEYIEVKTKGDAHALEGHLISYYKTYEWFNKAKSDYGLLSFINSNEFDWKLFEKDSDVLNQYQEDFNIVRGWRAREKNSSRYLSENPRNLDQSMSQWLKKVCELEDFLKKCIDVKETITEMKIRGESFVGRDLNSDLKQIEWAIEMLETELNKVNPCRSF